MSSLLLPPAPATMAPCTRAAALTPPSHSVFLLPLRGKLLPPLSSYKQQYKAYLLFSLSSIISSEHNEGVVVQSRFSQCQGDIPYLHYVMMV